MAEESGGRPFDPIAAYILLRLLLGFALLLVAAFALRDGGGSLAQLGAPFGWAAGVFLVMGVSAGLLPRYGHLPWFGWVQLAIDTVFASALVHVTGGSTSPLFLLFFVNIVAAGFIAGPRGPVVVAMQNAAAYLSLLAWAGVAKITAFWAGDALIAYVHVSLQVFGFFLVGLLASSLSANVLRARQALAVQERQIEVLRERHDLILAQLESGVLVLDAEGRVLDANRAARSFLGDLRGLPLPDSLQNPVRSWEQTLGEGAARRHVLCSRSGMEDGSSVLLIEDVSRIREMEALVEREERLSAVGRLAAGLAHELRNPLASLSGSIQLLRSDRPDPLHDIVLREVKRLNELVEEFLDSSRPVGIRLETVNINELVGELVVAIRNDPRCGDRVFDFSPSEEELVGRVDPSRMRQVLWNLLLNAAQASSSGGHIRLECRLRSDHLEIVVEDEGRGIEPDVLPRIFDPFFTRRAGGTGLGLANVERIVRAHGGRIEVQSAPKKGTRFTLVLPQGPREAQNGTER